MTESEPQDLSKARVVTIIASAFIIAACGLVYELLAGTLASYLLGNATQQYSITIGIFLAAMGVGSFVSRYIKRRLIWWFVATEFAIGVIGGFMPLALFVIYSTPFDFWIAVVIFSVAIGMLVGLEIPLIMRVLRARFALASTIGGVLAVDYFGALAAGLLFPLVVLPFLGIVRAGFLFGLLNIVVGLIACWIFGKKVRSLAPAGMILAIAMLVGLITAGTTSSWAEDNLYSDTIVYSKSTDKQRIIITRWRDDVRLFIDGALQFSSVDEARYHESLVHPATSSHPTPRSVLVLGGGDGLVVRELLKYKSIESIVLVDFDPEMLRLAKEVPALVHLNKNALQDQRVHLEAQDAMSFVEHDRAFYDIIIGDLPDPNHATLAKLYSTAFYQMVFRRLRPGGMFVTQATSPFYAPNAYATIAATVNASSPESYKIFPYRTVVPSFGEWGFVLAAPNGWQPSKIELQIDTTYLGSDFARSLFQLPKDIRSLQGQINTLHTPVLHRLYHRDYNKFFR